MAAATEAEPTRTTAQPVTEPAHEECIAKDKGEINDKGEQTQKVADTYKAATNGATAGAITDATAPTDVVKKRVLKKRKVAMFVAYLGKDYQGMQRNPDAHTIETTLEKAIVAVGGVSDDNAGSFSKVSWSRSARTDKGVSALCQVVSMKLVMHDNDVSNNKAKPQVEKKKRNGVHTTDDTSQDCINLKTDGDRLNTNDAATTTTTTTTTNDNNNHNGCNDDPKIKIAASTPSTTINIPMTTNPNDEEKFDIVTQINANLPKDIVILGVQRVTGGFCAKNECDRRVYEYVVPTYAFDPMCCRDKQFYIDNNFISPHSIIHQSETTSEENVKSLPTLQKFDDAQRSRLNSILKLFIGTHPFHNYTSGMRAGDPKSKRYILEFAANDAVFEMNGIEFVTLRVKGQSFILHQIRKMVGMTLAVMRGAATKVYIYIYIYMDCIAISKNVDLCIVQYAQFFVIHIATVM